MVFVEVDDVIRIKPPTNEERLAEGYRKRADRSRQLENKMKAASSEANDRLGDSPEPSE